MYYLAIRQFARSLKNLDVVIEKAQAYAKGRNFDVNNYCQTRMFPDMLPFLAQVRIACDVAKFTAAGLAGKEAPRHEDTETTIEELRGRIAKCLAYLDTLKEQDFANTKADTKCKIAYPPGKALAADEFLFARQLPNFYFHVVTAYDLLRAGGVEVGKGDYLGALNLLEA